jgi:hypothetical protein
MLALTPPPCHTRNKNGTVFRKKSAHIGLARDAAERRNFDSFRFFIPGWCQFKPQIFGKGIFAGLLYNTKATA